MGLVLSVAALLIGFFVCIVNMIYQKIEYKNYSEWKKRSAFNSPTAWGLYAVCFAIIIGWIFAVSFTNVITGFSNVFKQQNNIIQQQQDTSTQQEQDTSTEQENNSTQK